MGNGGDLGCRAKPYPGVGRPSDQKAEVITRYRAAHLPHPPRGPSMGMDPMVQLSVARDRGTTATAYSLPLLGGASDMCCRCCCLLALVVVGLAHIASSRSDGGPGRDARRPVALVSPPSVGQGTRARAWECIIGVRRRELGLGITGGWRGWGVFVCVCVCMCARPWCLFPYKPCASHVPARDNVSARTEMGTEFAGWPDIRSRKRRRPIPHNSISWSNDPGWGWLTACSPARLQQQSIHSGTPGLHTHLSPVPGIDGEWNGNGRSASTCGCVPRTPAAYAPVRTLRMPPPIYRL